MKIAQSLVLGMLFIGIQVNISEAVIANHVRSGEYDLSYQYSEVSSDTIPRVNPYRLILEQPSYKSDLVISAGLRGVGIGLIVTAGTMGLVYATTNDNSWDRAFGMVYMSFITYPIASTIGTASGLNKQIKRSTPVDYRVYSNALPVAMLTTLGIQVASAALIITTERPIFMLGILASTFIGGNIGAKSHIKTMNRYADDWDRGIEYLRVNPGSDLSIESLVTPNDAFSRLDTATVNPYQHLIQKEYSNKILTQSITAGTVTSILLSTVLLTLTDGSNFRDGNIRFVQYDFKPAFLGSTIFSTVATLGGFNNAVKRDTPIPPIQRYNTSIYTVLATGGTFGALFYASELADSPVPGIASLVVAPVTGALVGMHFHKKNLAYSSSIWSQRHSETWLKPNMIPESSLGIELVPDLSNQDFDLDTGTIRQSLVPVVKMTWRF